MAVLLDPKDQSDSFLSRGNLDKKYLNDPCNNIKHVIEINNVVIETMAHHPNLQMAAIFRNLYRRLKGLILMDDWLVLIINLFLIPES